MNLYVKNNRFWFELENLTRLFFPNEKINVAVAFAKGDDEPAEIMSMGIVSNERGAWSLTIPESAMKAIRAAQACFHRLPYRFG